MEDSDRIAARQAVAGFIDANAGDNQDNRRMAVVSFNGGLRIGQNLPTMQAALRRLRRGRSPPLRHWTRSGLSEVWPGVGRPSGRKTIVFLSGGLPQSSIQRAELTAAIDACNKSDVAVYSR